MQRPSNECNMSVRRSHPTVLLIEDEEGLQTVLRDRLVAEGYTVLVASDGQTGLDLARSAELDIVLLDLMLPGMSGLDVCRTLRSESSSLPILMLTAKGSVTDRVVGLRLGADDYLPKPFDTGELLARMDAVMRRHRPTPNDGPETVFFGDIEINFRSAEVTRASEPVELSAKEYQLLRYFVQRRGDALTRDDLLDGVWGHDVTPSTRTVDVHVAWLRQKLGDSTRAPKYIQTLHGIGYKFIA